MEMTAKFKFRTWKHSRWKMKRTADSDWPWFAYKSWKEDHGEPHIHHYDTINAFYHKIYFSLLSTWLSHGWHRRRHLSMIRSYNSSCHAMKNASIMIVTASKYSLRKVIFYMVNYFFEFRYSTALWSLLSWLLDIYVIFINLIWEEERFYCLVKSL